MVADALKSQIEALSPEERRELVAYIAKLDLETDDDYWRRVRKRLDDDAPKNWIPVEQL